MPILVCQLFSFAFRNNHYFKIKLLPFPSIKMHLHPSYHFLTKINIFYFSSIQSCFPLLFIVALITYTGLPHFISFHRFIVFSTNWRFMATLYQINLSVPFFQEQLLTSWLLCCILVILTTFQTFSFNKYLLWSVISDLWCYYCDCFRVPQTMLI